MTDKDRPSLCGCSSCGGPSARAAALRMLDDERTAARVVAWAPYVRATHPGEHARRVIPRQPSSTWSPCERSTFDMHWCIVHDAVLAEGAGWCESTVVGPRLTEQSAVDAATRLVQG